jgi:hypothetical protein
VSISLNESPAKVVGTEPCFDARDRSGVTSLLLVAALNASLITSTRKLGPIGLWLARKFYLTWNKVTLLLW